MTQPIITAAEPQLFVTDLKAACDFYTLKLGFTLAFVYGDPPFLGQVVRGAARLNLRSMDVPIFDAAIRNREELLSRGELALKRGGLRSVSARDWARVE
jgi:catechol 2,3-dioxygenase-like lactoylglutathione lyase family enzyme